jgi:hypothetical protein
MSPLRVTLCDGDEGHDGNKRGAAGETDCSDGLRKIVGAFPARASTYAAPNSVAGAR